MKKKCIALGVLSMLFISAYADEKELVETATSISQKKIAEASKDSVHWKFPGSVGLNANQAYFNDYCTEGTGVSVSTDAFVNLNANYEKDKTKWDNAFSAKYGFLYSSEFKGEEKKDNIRKNMDEFILSSKFGYKFSKYWYASALASMESQFTKGYSYEVGANGYDTATVISDFFAPASIKLSLGADYVPNKYISLFVSPLTARITVCRVNELAPNYSMEVKEAAVLAADGSVLTDAIYKKSRAELGAYLILRSDFDITKSLHFFSTLEGFYAYRKHIWEYSPEYVAWYGENPENAALNPAAFESANPEYKREHLVHGWSIKWKMELLMKVSKYLNISFRMQHKYDNSEQQVIEGVNSGLRKADLQFWETTSLGLSYKF